MKGDVEAENLMRISRKKKSLPPLSKIEKENEKEEIGLNVHTDRFTTSKNVYIRTHIHAHE